MESATASRHAPACVPSTIDDAPARAASTVRLAAGGGTIFVGAASVACAMTHALPWRRDLLLAYDPASAARLTHMLAFAGGLSLLGLGWGVLGGRRLAARAAMVMLIELALAHAVHGAHPAAGLVPAGLALLLYANRNEFRRGGAPHAGRSAAVVALGALVAAYTLDTADLLLSNRARGLGSALGAAGHALVTGAWWLRSGEPIAVALDLLVLVGLGAAILFVRALLMSVPGYEGHSPSDHARAAEIVQRLGHDSLDPFALREDKSFFFSRGGVVAYRTLRGTAVVSGDPIAPPGAAAGLARDFLDFARGQGWNVVFTGASQRYLEDFEAIGLRALCIGEEAVVRPDSFSLEGRAMRKVRQSVHRVERRGWSVEVVEGLDPAGAAAAQLERLEREWRAARPRVYGFAMSLGRLWGAPEDADAVYVLGRDQDGLVRAFIRFARAGGGLSLDAMRRSGTEPNGLYEAMISNLLIWAAGNGITEVSLNFAGFAHVMRDAERLTPALRVLRRLLTTVHGRFQLERLARFNEKFKPDWRPRYLVYRSRAQLPVAGLRVLQAEAYVRPPRSRALESRWRPFPYPIDRQPVLPQPEATR